MIDLNLKNDLHGPDHVELLHAVLMLKQQADRIEVRLTRILDREGVDPRRLRKWAEERGFKLCAQSEAVFK